jgi:membrane-associated phospholipid phosphatase
LVPALPGKGRRVRPGVSCQQRISLPEGSNRVETIVQTDFLLLDWIHPLRNSFLDVFFSSITWAGSLYLLVPATVLLLIFLRCKERYGEMLLVAVSMGSAVFVVYAAKLFFKRPRPEIHPGVVSIPVDWSFPSGHSTQIATFCLCVVFIVMRNFPGRWTWLSVLLALALTAGVGVSRIYLQVHYPTDVLAGIDLGIVIVVAADRLIKSRFSPSAPPPGRAAESESKGRCDA